MQQKKLRKMEGGMVFVYLNHEGSLGLTHPVVVHLVCASYTNREMRVHTGWVARARTLFIECCCGIRHPEIVALPCAALPTFYCWKRNDTFLSNYLVSPEPRGLLGLIWQLPRLIIWWRRQSLALQFKHSADVICNKSPHCKLPLCCVWTVWLSRWESLSSNLGVSSSLWICSYDSTVSMTVAGGIMF